MTRVLVQIVVVTAVLCTQALPVVFLLWHVAKFVQKNKSRYGKFYFYLFV